MNKTRRTALQEIADKVEELKGEIETLKDEEQDYFDNMPESFQMGDKGMAAEEAVSQMEYAIDGLDEIVTNLNDAQEV